MIQNRLLSLDIFRGITIAGMILVNNAGNEDFAYAPLKHAHWHGFTLTDLVFPSFMFIMGLSMRYSFASINYSYSPIVRNKIIKRAALLFIISYLIHLFPFNHWDFSHFRILGVLQRLGLCFAITAFIVLLVPSRWFTPINIALLLGYWAIMYLGGDYDETTNAALYFDRFVLGENHLYRGQGFPFDPEGLLSTIPSIATVLIGYQVGMALQKTSDRLAFVLKLAAVGLGLFALAWLWHGVFPVNKKLWTSSFVLNCAGLDMLLLAIVIYFVDIKKHLKWGQFFKIFGLNSIAAYVIADIIAISMYKIRIADRSLYSTIYSKIYQPIFGNSFGSLMFSISFVLVCWLFVYYMYKKSWFWKV
jgi:predicted acyltransferase